jgi:hypothetical protein
MNKIAVRFAALIPISGLLKIEVILILSAKRGSELDRGHTGK